MALTAFVFIGPEGRSAPERWVAGGRLAAAHDTVQQLARLPGVDRIVAAASAPELAAIYQDWPVTWDLDPPGVPFHFGERLAALTAAYSSDAYGYFGAGSAPLLPDAGLAEAVAEVGQARTPYAVTNNALSSDWIVFNCPDAIRARPERLGRDNMLGPVLRREAGVPVRGLSAHAAARADIDTPADLLALSLYPRLGPGLSAFLAANPAPASMLARWRAARATLFTSEGRVTLIGRVSAGAWSEVERRTRCWVRVFSEERGMTASGRQAARQVKSLIADHLQRVGPEAFFTALGGMADAIFFDTRVILAHVGLWPSAGDRYASDAGQPDLIENAFLRELTEAALAAPMPVLLGGHGVVAGDLYALLESGPQAPGTG